VIFGLFEYQFRYRQVNWSGALDHNIGVYTSWIDSSQAFLLLLLSLIGVIFVLYKSDWNRRQRAEMFLCACLASALALHISTALPVFARYYLLTTPFLGILAAAGLYSVSSRLYRADRPGIALAVFALLFSSPAAKTLIEDREGFRWRDFERVAATVDAVTPPGGALMADEHIYFLTGRPPPFGMELDDSHKLEFPPASAAFFHLLPQSELDRRIKARMYDTVETCQDDDEDLQELGLPMLYSKKMKFENTACTVFWSRVPR
jgi:hypothetical protein